MDINVISVGLDVDDTLYHGSAPAKGSERFKNALVNFKAF